MKFKDSEKPIQGKSEENFIKDEVQDDVFSVPEKIRDYYKNKGYYVRWHAKNRPLGIRGEKVPGYPELPDSYLIKIKI